MQPHAFRRTATEHVPLVMRKGIPGASKVSPRKCSVSPIRFDASRSSQIQVYARIRPPQRDETTLFLQGGEHACPIVQVRNGTTVVAANPRCLAPSEHQSHPKSTASGAQDSPRPMKSPRSANETPPIPSPLVSPRPSVSPSPSISPRPSVSRRPAGQNEHFNEYSFHHCFDDQASQEAVYSWAGQPLLDSIMEGRNTCLIAYGQTGSGKSYTMMGVESNRKQAITSKDSTEDGIIPRLLRDLFAMSSASLLPTQVKPSHSEQILSARIEVSYFEIYCEKIYDLLDFTSTVTTPVPVTLRDTTDGWMDKITRHSVVTPNEALRLLRRGNQRRATAETKLHERSSRSHAIFQITVTIVRPSTSVLGRTITPTRNAHYSCNVSTRVSVTKLVDLAGSERQKRSGVSGQQLEEMKNINLSLHVLGQVIRALNSQHVLPRAGTFSPVQESLRRTQTISSNRNMDLPSQCHVHVTANRGDACTRKGSGMASTFTPSTFVPYRESLLTIVLRSCLGGNCCTSIVATISPCLADLPESIATLEYATLAKSIVNASHIVEEGTPGATSLVRELQEEIKALNERLSNRQSWRKWSSPSIAPHVDMAVQCTSEDLVDALGVRNGPAQCELAEEISIDEVPSEVGNDPHDDEDQLEALQMGLASAQQRLDLLYAQLFESENARESIRMDNTRLAQEVQRLQSRVREVQQFLFTYSECIGDNFEDHCTVTCESFATVARAGAADTLNSAASVLPDFRVKAPIQNLTTHVFSAHFSCDTVHKLHSGFSSSSGSGSSASCVAVTGSPVKKRAAQKSGKKNVRSIPFGTSQSTSSLRCHNTLTHHQRDHQRERIERILGENTRLRTALDTADKVNDKLRERVFTAAEELVLMKNTFSRCEAEWLRVNRDTALRLEIAHKKELKYVKMIQRLVNASTTTQEYKSSIPRAETE